MQAYTNLQSNQLTRIMVAFRETSKQILTERDLHTGLSSKRAHICHFARLTTSSVIHKEPDHIDRSGKTSVPLAQT